MRNGVTHAARERCFDNVVINWWYLVLLVQVYIRNCEITVLQLGNHGKAESYKTACHGVVIHVCARICYEVMGGCSSLQNNIELVM